MVSCDLAPLMSEISGILPMSPCEPRETGVQLTKHSALRNQSREDGLLHKTGDHFEAARNVLQTQRLVWYRDPRSCFSMKNDR